MAEERENVPLRDGPASPGFTPVPIKGNVTFASLARVGLSREMADAAACAPSGECVSWGIPFRVTRPLLIKDKPLTLRLKPLKARWLLFLHVADRKPIATPDGAFTKPMTGHGLLGERAADYVIVYADGGEERAAIRHRREVQTFGAPWGEAALEAVNHHKPFPVGGTDWREDYGGRQVRARGGMGGAWTNSVWAWENPRPSKAIAAIRVEPAGGAVVISGVSAGTASAHPLRWLTRCKAVLTLPRGARFQPGPDDHGLFEAIQLDMGQVISVSRRPIYPAAQWRRTYNNKVPAISDREVIVEYTAHPDALFHLSGGRTVPVASLEKRREAGPLEAVTRATERVLLRVIDKGSGKEVPVKLHVHGAAGEYLAPVDRHRIPNGAWFEDVSVDFLTDECIHFCTYIPGRTIIDLPIGPVFIEVSKGLEMRPVRKVVRVRRGAREITIEIEKVLPWREKGWVTADTHVHFLSPQTALLEGAGEGVNVTNLLASQWGELMTNVGDFDGRTTMGSREAGGDGEYLVRVGTENRQHILGHISLLGYSGDIIAPMTTGGPDESAIGDPVGCLITEWARQCRKQGGIVIIPHFPWPRAEHAATIIGGDADAVEINSRVSVYNGLHPYSLADWYRYLNNGYHVAAVGGTDKMSAAVSVGMVRTYARVDPSRPFTYDAWKDAIRSGTTFVTFGPLMEFSLEGQPPGSRIRMTSTGGTVDVAWHVASVTVPMTRVDLIVSGEVRESRAVRPGEDRGSWRLKVERSSWIALLVRGRQSDKLEAIMAHSSAVMVDVAGSEHYAAADAATILDQIEGALAYIDIIGTRAETKRYKEMRLTLVSAWRSLHSRMHRLGHYHDHPPAGTGGARR